MLGAAALRLAHAVAGMEARIAQRVDLLGGLAHDDNRARTDIAAHVVAVGLEPARVVDRQPRPGEDLRQFGGEHVVALEELGRWRDLTAVVDLLAKCLDAVG